MGEAPTCSQLPRLGTAVRTRGDPGPIRLSRLRVLGETEPAIEIACVFSLLDLRSKGDRPMRLRNRSVFLLALLLAGADAQAAHWSLLRQRSHLAFSGTYESTRETGYFRKFRVKMTFNPRRPSAGKMRIYVHTPSVKMNYRDATRTIKSARWLDVSRYPQAQFSSRDIREKAPGHYIAKGTLKLKGVTRTIRLAFTWHGSGTTATMKGRKTLPASAFELGRAGSRQPSNDSHLTVEHGSRTVTLSFDIHLRKRGG